MNFYFKIKVELKYLIEGGKNMKFKKGDRVRPLVTIGEIPKGALCLVISVNQFHHKVSIFFPQPKDSIFEEDDITYIEDCDESLLTLDNDTEIPDYWEDSYLYF